MPIVRSKEGTRNNEIEILIEMDEATVTRGPYSETRGVTDRVVGEIRDAFEEGLALSSKCAEKAVGMIKAMSDTVRPQEFSMQLAIKLDADLGAIIAKTSTGAQLQVTMKWIKKDQL